MFIIELKKSTPIKVMFENVPTQPSILRKSQAFQLTSQYRVKSIFLLNKVDYIKLVEMKENTFEFLYVCENVAGTSLLLI